jgi:hypothetical protein
MGRMFLRLGEDGMPKSTFVPADSRSDLHYVKEVKKERCRLVLFQMKEQKLVFLITKKSITVFDPNGRMVDVFERKDVDSKEFLEEFKRSIDIRGEVDGLLVSEPSKR